MLDRPAVEWFTGILDRPVDHTQGIRLAVLPPKEPPPTMHITQLDTIQLAEFPNILFVQLHTDEGLVGLGETFFGAPEVSTYLHESAAQLLLGQDPSAIDALRVKLKGYVGTQGTGVEARGASAID